MMRNCVRDEVKDCFKDTEVSDEMADEVAQSVVVESLPMEDAVVTSYSNFLFILMFFFENHSQSAITVCCVTLGIPASFSLGILSH